MYIVIAYNLIVNSISTSIYYCLKSAWNRIKIIFQKFMSYCFPFLYPMIFEIGYCKSVRKNIDLCKILI